LGDPKVVGSNPTLATIIFIYHLTVTIFMVTAPYLEYTDDGNEKRQLAVGGTLLTIGRSPETDRLMAKYGGIAAEVSIDLGVTDRDKIVSRRHASFLYRDDELLVEDLGSTNGTMVNASLLEPRRLYQLRHNDNVYLGPGFSLVAVIKESVEESMFDMGFELDLDE